jgi:PTS system mannose-specific IIC component
MNALDVIPFAGLGAVLGMDVVSFPQAMISRPLVAATLAGALAGDPNRGLLIGAVLEMVALGTLPFGAARYPDWGTASVVGGALYASGPDAARGHLALAVLSALVAAWLSSESMVWLRKMNGRLTRAARSAPVDASRNPAVALQVRGLLGDLARGALVTAAALAVLAPAYGALGKHWGGGAAVERALVAGLTSALGAATIWMLVRGTTGTRALIAVGLVIGVALVI